MHVGFLLGLALAVPLAILANLLTPATQRLLFRTSGTGRVWLERRRAREAQLVERWATAPELFTHWLLLNILSSVVMLFVTLVAIGGLLISSAHGSEHERMVDYVIGEILAAFATSLLFQRFQVAGRRRRAVRDLVRGKTGDAQSDPTE